MTNLIKHAFEGPIYALSSCYVNNIKSNKDSLNSVGKLDKSKISKISLSV